MLQKLLLLLFVSSVLFLAAVDFDNSAQVTSHYNYTFTGEHYAPEYSALTSHNGYDFPLQSWSKFGTTLSNYFTSGTKQQSLLLYQQDQYQVEGHVLGGTEYYRNNKRDSYFFPYYGFEVKAHYQNLSLAGKWWKGHTTSQSDFAETNPLINSWVQREKGGEHIYIDKIQGEIKYSFNDFGYVALTRNKLNIGSNIGGSIILNDSKTNDYSYLNYNLKFGDFSVDFIHASLISDSINASAGSSIPKEELADKYLALHRFSWRPSDRLNLFVGEEIYYGNRNIDYNYFIPIGFWRITEHNQTDRDNVLIFAGGDYTITAGLDIYANVIFDELSKSKLRTNWWGNKYALQTGVMKSELYTSPLFSWDNLGAEVTAVRPWTYTHKYYYANASNDVQALGFADGSNLLKYTVENRVSFLNHKLDYVLNASYLKQGSDGDNCYLNYEDEFAGNYDAEVSWFSGEVSKTYKLLNEININLLYSHRLKLSSEITKVEGSHSNVDFAISYQTRF